MNKEGYGLSPKTAAEVMCQVFPVEDARFSREQCLTYTNKVIDNVLKAETCRDLLLELINYGVFRVTMLNKAVEMSDRVNSSLAWGKLNDVGFELVDLLVERIRGNVYDCTKPRRNK